MFARLKNIDGFTRSIIVVFVGTSVANLFNFLFQLFVAHRFSAPSFAAFNTLLAIYVIIATPLTTLQTAMVKFCAGYNALRETDRLKLLLSRFLKGSLILGVLTFLVFSAVSGKLLAALKISSSGATASVLTFLIALSWLLPVFLGGVQGLERFGWFSAIAVATGALKLGCAFILLRPGSEMEGALASLLIATIVETLLCLFVLRDVVTFREPPVQIPFRKILAYLLPVAVGSFCFILMVSMDMVMVKLFFSPEDAGFYSLAQMLGKIFLFLPTAISMVMLPKTSGLHATQGETTAPMKKSLLCAAFLCTLAVVVYNIFPEFALRLFTGKSFAQSVLLGRAFSLTMTFFSFVFILITYFLSIEDMRFLVYVICAALLQFAGIYFFHASLIQVQAVMCSTAVVLFAVLLVLANTPLRSRVCRT